MFVLHELEKLLHNFITNQRYGPTNRPNITLTDIDRFDANQLQLTNMVQLQPISISQRLQLDSEDEPKWVNFGDHQLTTDIVFALSMKTIVLNQLIKMPQRAYPSARLMICDRRSYELLAKFQCLSQQLSQSNSADESNFFIYKQPFNITAILLLDDIIATIDSLKRPFVAIKRDKDGRQGASYDYTIIKQIFPYLKITDLAIVLDEIGTFRLKTFTTDGKKEHQILQFITHYARSTQLIELQSIRKLIGNQHPMYDNVSIFRLLTKNSSTISFDHQQEQNQKQRQSPQPDVKKLMASNHHLTPNLPLLTQIAGRLIDLVQRLGWSLESITFRAGDPTGFTKIFSQILDSSLKYNSRTSKSPTNSANKANVSITPVRLLVLDRYTDLQGLLRHAQRYGSFVEQEMDPPPLRAKTSQIDSLYRTLISEKLTDVLSTILKLSVSVKPKSVGEQSAASPPKKLINNNNNHADAHKFSSLATNQAMHKHLNIIKSMYKIMNEGYLLLLKLETNIEAILDSLRNLNSPLDIKEQDETAERLKRIGTVFMQLVNVNSSSIKISDCIRFACLLIDAISVFLFLHPNVGASGALVDLKAVFVFGKKFEQSLNAIADLHGNDLNDNDKDADKDNDKDETQVAKISEKRADADAKLRAKLDIFDAISSEGCANRSLLTLEEIVECFYKRQLDARSHPCLKLSSSTTGLIKSGSKNKIIVLLLGSITYDELNRLKSLETRLMRAKYGRSGQAANEFNSRSDMLTIACDLITPRDFIKSL